MDYIVRLYFKLLFRVDSSKFRQLCVFLLEPRFHDTRKWGRYHRDDKLSATVYGTVEENIRDGKLV
jgi:hypothetical protein